VRPDSMLVSVEMITEASSKLSPDDAAAALDSLAECEPELTGYVARSMMAIAGKLALSGAPSEVVRGFFDDAIVVALTSIRALRVGHYELWRETQVGSRLGQLDESLRTTTSESKGAASQES